MLAGQQTVNIIVVKAPALPYLLPLTWLQAATVWVQIKDFVVNDEGTLLLSLREGPSGLHPVLEHDLSTQTDFTCQLLWAKA